MTNTENVLTGGKSQEQVALRLLKIVSNIEDRPLYRTNDIKNPADRKWLLDTYAECLSTVKGHRKRP